jgi:hypothetical protein
MMDKTMELVTNLMYYDYNEPRCNILSAAYGGTPREWADKIDGYDPYAREKHDKLKNRGILGLWAELDNRNRRNLLKGLAAYIARLKGYVVEDPFEVKMIEEHEARLGTEYCDVP